jgi:hypothetical protein
MKVLSVGITLMGNGGSLANGKERKDKEEINYSVIYALMILLA